MQASRTTCERRSLADSLSGASRSRSCCGKPSCSAAPASISERTFFSCTTAGVQSREHQQSSIWKHLHLQHRSQDTHRHHAMLPVVLVVRQHLPDLAQLVLQLSVGVDLRHGRRHQAVSFRNLASKKLQSGSKEEAEPQNPANGFSGEGFSWCLLGPL